MKLLAFAKRLLRREPSMPDVADVAVPGLPRAFGDAPIDVARGVLVIPDISGYTELVSATELVHAHEIVMRLMKAIVDNCWEVLQVSKLIGDAVLMYRPDDGSDGPDVQRATLRHIATVYEAFRRERAVTREDRHVCDCHACQTVERLELKFIVHYGEFGLYEIGPFRELMGKDVILAFRLLKNGVTRERYVLMTEPFLALDDSIRNRLLDAGGECYEHLGHVGYGLLDPASPF